MPLLFDDPEPDLVGLGEGLSLMPLPGDLARGVLFDDAQQTDRLGGFLRVEDAKAFDRDLQRMTGYSDAISADEANRRFGVEGETLFKAPVLPVEAAWQQRQAKERQFRDYVLRNSDIGPLSTIFAGVAGTLLDPVSLPLMFLPELLGVAKLGQAAFTLARGAKAGGAVVKAGRLATASRYALEGAAEGLVGGAAYEALNYGLRNYEGDDYSFGDAGRNLILGAVLGAGAKGLLGAILPPGAENGLASDSAVARGVLRGEAGPGFGPEDLRAAAAIEALPETRLPETVERLPEEQRAAATMLAVERVIDDAPVDLAPVIQRQEAANLKALDEMPGTPGTLKGRMLEADVAVTTRGDEVPVRYALVEIEDLVTSHDDDLIVNPDYPAALQPRARDRAGAIARNRELQSQLNPLRLLREAGAESGAPIVDRDGVVESGNGRTIALRRAAREDHEAWGRYRAALAEKGFNIDGMDRPVLVRVRENELTGEARAALARDMNRDVTERLSLPEQAMADAKALDPATLDLLQAGEVTSATNRPFVRAFLQTVASDQINSLVDGDGVLSQAGVQRVRAALAAQAYGDRRLVEAVFEDADPNIKAIGRALVDAAPGWSRMRAAIARGETAAEVDFTDHLRSAVDLVRHARDNRVPLAELISDRLDSVDMFGGNVLTPQTEAFVRLFFRDEALRTPRGAESIAAALDDLSRQGQAVVPGPDLFGDTPDAAARTILNAVLDKARRDSAKQPADLLADVPAIPERPKPAAEPFVGHVPEAGGQGAQPVAAGSGPEGGRPAAGPERGAVDPAADAPGVTFKTAKGSTYRVESNGGTTRDKAARPEHPGPAERGLQPTSEDTFYTTTEQANALAIMQAKGGAAVQVVRQGDSYAIQYRDGPDAGKFIAGTVITPAREPQIGLMPVELWNGGTRIHFGNQIVEVSGPPAAPAGVAEPAAAPPATGRGQKLIEADPDLKALLADTRAYVASDGGDLFLSVKDEPETIAEALRAAAFCIREGGLS